MLLEAPCLSLLLSSGCVPGGSRRGLAACTSWYACRRSTEPPHPANQTLTILAPPPGKTVRDHLLSLRTNAPKTTPGAASPAIADSTDIAFDADETQTIASRAGRARRLDRVCPGAGPRAAKSSIPARRFPCGDTGNSGSLGPDTIAEHGLVARGGSFVCSGECGRRPGGGGCFPSCVSRHTGSRDSGANG